MRLYPTINILWIVVISKEITALPIKDDIIVDC